MSVLLRPVLGAALLLLVPTLAMAQAAAPAAPATETAKPATSADAKSEAPTAKDGGRRLAVCRADIEKLCPDAKSGGRRTCLKDNTAKLSPECAAAFADVEAKAKAMREACVTDVQTHCATAGKGKGGDGIAQCLRTNEAKLSAACNTAVKARYGSS